MDNIEYDIADTLIERPIVFEVENRQFYLYPLTIGKSYLVLRLLKSLEIDEEVMSKNQYFEALRLCSTKRDLVLRFVVYHTIKRKDQLFDNKLVEARCRFFGKHMSDEELAKLFILTTSGDNTDLFQEHLGIKRENTYKSKIVRFKKDSSSSISLGGVSIYGSLIDHACERYGWPYDYVVWGISYANLKMLLSDSISTYYLSKDELRQLHIPTDRRVVSGDSKENISKFKSMFKD